MRAFVVSEVDEQFSMGVRDVDAVARDEGDVLVAVEYSGINFKDTMVAAPKSRVRRVATLTGGVDAAGTVVSSTLAHLPVGTRVAAHGGPLGVSRDAGFAKVVYDPERSLSPLPDVNTPSSKIWRNLSRILGWAFSISSKRTTLKGFSRMAFVSSPPMS